jgi:hypothetical protein
MGTDPAVSDARYILAWMRRTSPERFTPRDLFTDLPRGRFAKVGLLDAPLAVLESHGYVRRLPPPRIDGRPGRPPSPTYEVNPLALSAESAESAEPPPQGAGNVLTPSVASAESAKNLAAPTTSARRQELPHRRRRRSPTGHSRDDPSSGRGHAARRPELPRGAAALRGLRAARLDAGPRRAPAAQGRLRHRLRSSSTGAPSRRRRRGRSSMTPAVSSHGARCRWRISWTPASAGAMPLRRGAGALSAVAPRSLGGGRRNHGAHPPRGMRARGYPLAQPRAEKVAVDSRCCGSATVPMVALRRRAAAGVRPSRSSRVLLGSLAATRRGRMPRRRDPADCVH